ncbi:hypothetical protein ACPPVT_09440 [Angustibacter sp. McL0619]|uniref:hypothetical protein n=1 Tax=Angustibacter sp. McL0619 TaxID=3415676 RepID=UPI003CFB8716
MQNPPEDVAKLRRGTLAASVLHDIPLEPREDGVVVGSQWDERNAWTSVGWHDLALAVDGADPESLTGRLRLRDWLNAYVTLAQLPALHGGAHAKPSRAVALALPVGHPLHPGQDWVVERVLGGVLHVGIGLRRPPDAEHHEQLAVPLPASAATAAGIDTRPWWKAIAKHREEMAVLAADRLQTDGGGILKPLGGCDVLTLLSGHWLRKHLATEDGIGMRAVAAPMRSRGWFDLARIDPAFVGAAAVATEPELRGVQRPLLVTAEEVGLAVALLSPEALARTSLADPAGSRAQHQRDVLFR